VRRLVLAVAAAALVAGCGGGGGAGETPATPRAPATHAPTVAPAPTPAQAIEMTVRAAAGTNARPGTSCGDSYFGTRYSGLPGSLVTVSNEAGLLVGVGQIPASGVIASRPNASAAGTPTVDCAFTFTVPLDGAARFYRIDLGSFGSTTISASDLEAHRYALDLDLSAGL
jgi:hypothetical protein